MKETSFIKQNKDKWRKFEKLYDGRSRNPEEVSKLFVEITDDLAYARTHYPRRSVRVYLNSLAQKVFTSVYKSQKNSLSKFFRFWTHGLPLEMYRARKTLLVSFVVFLVSALIGAVSTADDPDFLAVFTGDYYVDVTEQNINKGDPMAIYKSEGEELMMLGITVNNIRVSFLVFVMGILFSLGTYTVLAFNGMMLGSFQWFFQTKGLLYTSFLTIWIHGALEISAIIIAGAAGLTVGNGLLFPKTYSRGQSLFIAAKRGIKIMVGLMPIFIMAGFLESYVTRHTEMPEFGKLFIIFGSFAFILWYFVWYPYRKFRNSGSVQLDENIAPTEQMNLSLSKIRKSGEIFTAAFSLYRKNLKPFLKTLFRLFLPVTFVVGFLSIQFHQDQASIFRLGWQDSLAVLFGAGRFFEPIQAVLWIFAFSLIFGSVAYFFREHFSENKPGKACLRRFLKHALLNMLKVSPFLAGIYLPLVYGPNLVKVLLLTMAPVLLNAAFAVTLGGNMFKNAARSIAYAFGSWTSSMGLFLSLGLMTVAFFFLIHDPFGLDYILSQLTELILWHTMDNVSPFYVANIVQFIAYGIFLCLVLPIYVYAFGLYYYRLFEINTASGLKSEVEKFGKASSE